MDEKEKKLVQRYIDGEKQLMSKLSEIHSKITANDICSYSLYLKYLFEDDYENMVIHKREIQKDISHKGLKPNFPKKQPILPKKKPKS